METVKSKIKLPEDVVSGERPLPGLYMATVLLYAHIMEKDIISSLSLFLRAIISFMMVGISQLPSNYHHVED